MSDSLNVTPLAVGEWDSTLNNIAADMHGRPLNVHKLMANHPELLIAWWSLRNHAVKGGALRERHRELIILRVAVYMKSWYEWASHVERGLKAGITVDEIERIRNGVVETGWEINDALVLRAAGECLHERKVSSKTRVAMSDHFDASQIMDLIAICGVYLILGTMINTWGLELDDFIELPNEISEEDWRAS